MSIVVEEAPRMSEQVTETQGAMTEEVSQADNIQEETQLEASSIESSIPEKYAGKSLEAVIEMHQNAEKAIGKQGQEVGEQRKLIETLIANQQQATEATLPTEEPIKFEDAFYDDPASAVNSAIENHPDVVKARESRAKQAHDLSTSELEAKHPDFRDVVKDSDFIDWVKGSEIRQELFRRADDYDFNSANELFSTWKQISTLSKTEEIKVAEEVKRQEALRKTSTETRSSGDSVGGKKSYRRADLINLQMTDPSRYAALSDEIFQAYAEDRVR